MRSVMAREKSVPVDSQGAARRHCRGIGGLHEKRPAAPQFFLEATDRIVHPCAAQTVGADQFGQIRIMVGG